MCTTRTKVVACVTAPVSAFQSRRPEGWWQQNTQIIMHNSSRIIETLIATILRERNGKGVHAKDGINAGPANGRRDKHGLRPRKKTLENHYVHKSRDRQLSHRHKKQVLITSTKEGQAVTTKI